MAGMALLESKKKQEAADKNAKIQAALGSAPTSQEQGGGDGNAALLGNLLGAFGGDKGGEKQLINPSGRNQGLTDETAGMLDEQGFTGINAPSNKDLLEAY
jgi:hypothetical protein